MSPTSIWSAAYKIRLLAATLILSPLLVAISAWLHHCFSSDNSELALAGAGYIGLAIAVGRLSLRQSEAADRSMLPRSEAGYGRSALADLFRILLQLRPYGLLLTAATLSLSANAIVIAAFAKSPQVSVATRIAVIEIVACPNVWTGLFVNYLAFLGWLILTQESA